MLISSPSAALIRPPNTHLMSPTTTQAYRLLINDRVSFLSQSWGEAQNRILAFVPKADCRDPEAAVQRMINLFTTYDPRPRNQYGEYPPPPSVRQRHNMTYINITNERLLGTLTAYFEAVLPRELGHTVYTNELDEGGPDISFSYDEAAIKELAMQCAKHFAENEIENCHIMLPHTPAALEEHACVV